MLDLDMSPYAVFVWGSWAVSALALGLLAARAVVASRRWTRELESLEQPDDPGAQVARSAIAPKT